MSYWWDGDGTERFWVEIRWEKGIGLDLACRLVSEDGDRNPYYDLVGQVRPGDVVYHWNAHEHRFVGRSTVATSRVDDGSSTAGALEDVDHSLTACTLGRGAS